MKANKIIIPISAIILLFLISIVLFTARYNLLEWFNNTFNYKSISELNMTNEEKKEDFKYFYDTIISSCPLIDEQKNTMKLILKIINLNI